MRSSMSTRMTRTSTFIPGRRTSSGESILVSESSEMCNRPSRSSSSLTKTPKLVVLVTKPESRSPMWYLLAISSSQGSGVSCFMPRAMRFFSLSTESTTHWTLSPFFTTSDGCVTFLVQLMSVMCSRPSMPSSISTKAP